MGTREIVQDLYLARMTRNGLARAEHVVPRQILWDAHQLWPALLHSLELKIDGPLTLLHQDVHTRNWYITDDGRMGLYDWQAVARGSWAVDWPTHSPRR
jgi:aminoglycoside phosphotransferase (APT) family kinase protein